MQKGAVNRHINDLLAQLFLRAQRHIGHGHFLQVGDVLFQVLERILDLQRKQAAQAYAVLGGGHFRLVKHLNANFCAVVDQGGKANQRGIALADFHQLRQLTKGPARVALLGFLRGSCLGRLLIFRSCLRLTLFVFRYFSI